MVELVVSGEVIGTKIVSLSILPVADARGPAVVYVFSGALTGPLSGWPLSGPE